MLRVVDARLIGYICRSHQDHQRHHQPQSFVQVRATSLVVVVVLFLFVCLFVFLEKIFVIFQLFTSYEFAVVVLLSNGCHGFRESLSQILEAGKVVDNPISLADFGATLTSADSSQLQAVLECNDVSTY